MQPSFVTMEKYYIYIIYSASLDKYYTGSTNNIEARLKRHNAGATKSTKAGRPWVLVYTEEYQTRAEAYNREQYIKKQKSRTFIENLIKSKDS